MAPQFLTFNIYFCLVPFFIFSSFVSFFSPFSSSLCESCLGLFVWFGVSSRGLRPSRLFNKDAQTDSLVVDVVSGCVGGTTGDNLPGCKFDGFNLKRHIQVHVKKGKISQDNVTNMSTIMSTGFSKGKNNAEKKVANKKEGESESGSGCDKIVFNVGRHLSRSKEQNIVKGSSHYLRLSKQQGNTRALQSCKSTLKGQL